MQRVQKLIAASGFCSRRKAEEFIIAGKVTVNGKKITIGDKASEKDLIQVGKQKIIQEKHLYLMLHKPSGYLSTKSDLFGRKDVMEFIRTEKSVYPVGRLDREARGLLLFTSDGDFAQKILHPKNLITKTYQAALKTPLTSEAIKRITTGVVVDRRKVRAKIRKVKPRLVEITIHEGRNKIVKRIFNEVGCYVSDLKRTAIGRLRLNIAEGTTRELSESDKEKIFQ